VENLRSLFTGNDSMLMKFLSSIEDVNENPLYRDILIKFNVPEPKEKSKEELEEEEKMTKEERMDLKTSELRDYKLSQVTKAKDLAQMIINSLIANLEDRFKDLEDLCVFDLLNFQVANIRASTYGKDEMENDKAALIKVAQYLNQINARTPIKLHIDSNRLVSEWNHFRLFIKNGTSDDDYESYLLNGSLSYPNLTSVYEYYSCLPISTVECERAFSKLKIIKTDRRNRLEEGTLGALMMISINGPPLEEFDPKEAIENRKIDGYKYRLFA
jgi:hypothetical protein